MAFQTLDLFNQAISGEGGLSSPTAVLLGQHPCGIPYNGIPCDCLGDGSGSCNNPDNLPIYGLGTDSTHPLGLTLTQLMHIIWNVNSYDYSVNYSVAGFSVSCDLDPYTIEMELYCGCHGDASIPGYTLSSGNTGTIYRSAGSLTNMSQTMCTGGAPIWSASGGVPSDTNALFYSWDTTAGTGPFPCTGDSGSLSCNATSSFSFSFSASNLLVDRELITVSDFESATYYPAFSFQVQWEPAYPCNPSLPCAVDGAVSEPVYSYGYACPTNVYGPEFCNPTTILTSPSEIGSVSIDGLSFPLFSLAQPYTNFYSNCVIGGGDCTGSILPLPSVYVSLVTSSTLANA